MIYIPECTEELVNLKDRHVAKYGTCAFHLDADSRVQPTPAVNKTTKGDSAKNAQSGNVNKTKKVAKRKKSAALVPIWTDSDSDANSDQAEDKENSAKAPKKKPPKKLSTPQDHATKDMAVDFLPMPGSSRRKQATPQKTSESASAPTSTVVRAAMGTLFPPESMILT